MQMLKNWFFILITMSASLVHAMGVTTNTAVIDVKPTSYARMKILLAVVGQPTPELQAIVPLIKKDLEFSNQFILDIKYVAPIKTKDDIACLLSQGYSLALFINSAEGGAFEWRLYDVTQVAMLKGAKYIKRGQIARGWAHHIADSLWLALTGQEGFFSTRIAYCKDVAFRRKRKVKHIYIADYDGSNEELLVATSTVNVAPRWNNDSQNPMLFYSEYTNSNVRLVSTTLRKERRIASNCNGITMLPSFSANGKHVVYCASHGGGSCQLYSFIGGASKNLTHNSGNNVSPSLSPDGSQVFFCSDFQTGSPQIYCYDMATDKIDRLTDGGYCASPNFCSKNKRIAYSKIVNGVMQLFVYDLIAKEHVQITFDKGHKEEASWSPCGNYLLFSLEEGAKSRLALLNLLTNDRMYLTKAEEVCTYPAWSGVFEQLPVVG